MEVDWKGQEDKREVVKILYSFIDVYKYTANKLTLYMLYILQLFSVIINLYLANIKPLDTQISVPLTRNQSI